MKILIVGLGIIGGGYAKALYEKGHIVVGADQCEATLEYALKKAYIHEAVDEAHIEAALKEAEVVIIGLYPEQTKAFCKRYKAAFRPGVVITDVSGIKAHLIQEIEPELRADVDFVFSHPMAGKESSGIFNADPGIFKGANFIITPTQRNQKKHIALIEGLAREIGFKNVTLLDPEQHDKVISYTSQICHVIALALVNADSKSFSTGKFTGGSYRDLTRIAMMNDALWSELFFGNKGPLLETLDEFLEEMKSMRGFIENENIEGMRAYMQTATHHRKCIDGQGMGE